MILQTVEQICVHYIYTYVTWQRCYNYRITFFK